MKRWFVIITSMIYISFFCLIIGENPDAMLFTMYPNVWVRSLPENADIEQIQDDLDALGKRTDSLIALRIARPSDDRQTSRFSYALFGQGKVPDGFIEASENDKKQLDPVNTYSILHGSLSLEELSKTLDSYGAETNYDLAESSPVLISLGYIPRPSISFSLLLFSLLFIILTSMQRINQLRSSGIQVLSGMNRSQIFKKSLWDDSLSIVLGFTFATFLSIAFLYFKDLWNWKLLIFLMTCAGINAFLLFVLALFIELLFWWILKRSHLIDLIKGRMPITSVLTVLLVGQFIAFLGVGYGSHMVTEVYPLYQAMNLGREAWAGHPDAFQFSMNLGAFDPYQQERQYQRDLAWYDLTVEALMKEDIIYCEHFLQEQDLILPSLEESRKILIVSPSFLEKERVLTNPDEQERMENLKPGEFGLILPKKLSRTQKNEAENALKTFIFNQYWGKELDYAPDKIHPILFERSTEDPVFIYNYEGKPPIQFLDDPYIIVLTPKATGRSPRSASVWSSHINSSLLFSDFDQTEELIQKYSLSPLVSRIRNIRGVYLEEVETYRFEAISLIIGSIIGTLVAAFSFVVMNRLYFEHFRREIFIRRISGFSFYQNHLTYLRLQGLVLTGGLILLFLLSRKLLLNLLVYIIFFVLEGGLLYQQMKKENQSAVTLLKGE